MIKGIGIDAVELSRIEKIIKDRPSFIQRVLTPKEYQVFLALSAHRQVEFLGGRFCCKEAFSKAWGTGIGGIAFQDIEVLPNEKGTPVITQSPHVGTTFVSITHTDTMAIAYIILEEGIE